MKIHVLSDLHFELIASDARNNLTTPVDADLTIIAGDFYRASDAIQYGRLLFPNLPLILVAGNHEHYRSQISVLDGNELMRDAARSDSHAFGRETHFLENETIELEVAGQSARIIGCTLWTDFKLFHSYAASAEYAEWGMSDYHFIRSSSGGKLKPDETARWHAESRAYLERQLRMPYIGKTIVVTHHLPSERSVHSRFKTDGLTPAFASNCDHLLDLGPDLWIHGHTHDSCDYIVNGRTRVISNPRGYSDRDGPFFGIENQDFAEDLIIEI